MGPTHSPTDRLDTIAFHLHGPAGETGMLHRPVLVVLVGLVSRIPALDTGLGGSLVSVAMGRRACGRRRGRRGGRVGIAGGGEWLRLTLGGVRICHSVERRGLGRCDGQGGDMYRLKVKVDCKE
jgi:hypothetical protein